MHYLLMYETAPDYPQRRGEFRAAHLAMAWEAAERGEIVLGGAVGDPVERAIILFDCQSADVPAAFAKSDPYVLNGVVKSWRVVPWHTVVGAAAANPVR